MVTQEVIFGGNDHSSLHLGGRATATTKFCSKCSYKGVCYHVSGEGWKRFGKCIQWYFGTDYDICFFIVMWMGSAINLMHVPCSTKDSKCRYTTISASHIYYWKRVEVFPILHLTYNDVSNINWRLWYIHILYENFLKMNKMNPIVWLTWFTTFCMVISLRDRRGIFHFYVSHTKQCVIQIGPMVHILMCFWFLLSSWLPSKLMNPF